MEGGLWKMKAGQGVWGVGTCVPCGLPGWMPTAINVATRVRVGVVRAGVRGTGRVKGRYWGMRCVVRRRERLTCTMGVRRWVGEHQCVEGREGLANKQKGDKEEGNK